MIVIAYSKSDAFSSSIADSVIAAGSIQASPYRFASTPPTMHHPPAKMTQRATEKTREFTEFLPLWFSVPAPCSPCHRFWPFPPTTWLNLMNCGQNGRSHPTTWLNLMNWGQNGRFHPTTWLNLMNWGQNGRFHPTPWLNLMNCGQNGRFPPHPLAKLDELGRTAVPPL